MLEIHGKPANLKNNHFPKRNKCAFLAEFSQSSNLGRDETQKGDFFITSSVSSEVKAPWIIDSGATNHMTVCSQLFSSYAPCFGGQKVRVVDGSLSLVTNRIIPISKTLVLNSILHVPNLSCNLFSVSKFTKEISV